MFGTNSPEHPLKVATPVLYNQDQEEAKKKDQVVKKMTTDLRAVGRCPSVPKETQLGS